MAMPGILMQLARNNPMMQRIKQMMGMVKAGQDPQAMINQMVASNPQFKQVMDYINQSGGDPQKAFYQTAERMGVDPQEILEMFK